MCRCDNSSRCCVASTPALRVQNCIFKKETYSTPSTRRPRGKQALTRLSSTRLQIAASRNLASWRAPVTLEFGCTERGRSSRNELSAALQRNHVERLLRMSAYAQLAVGAGRQFHLCFGAFGARWPFRTEVLGQDIDWDAADIFSTCSNH
jgi:hypothetical protein